MTKEFIEANGYEFCYTYNAYGFVELVRIIHAVNRGNQICAHFNERGAIDAFSRRNYNGKLIPRRAAA